MTTDRKDEMIRAVAAESTVRAFAIDGTALVENARVTHRLSRVATAALGRQLMMTVMMASELKSDQERLSTIVAGNGPGGNQVCTGCAAGRVKGYITNGEIELPPTAAGKLDVSALVGSQGKLTVVKDLMLKEPYVGSAPLVSGEIAEDFANYYMLSQQQPSVVYLGVHVDAATGRVRAAGGVLLQPMPDCPEETLDKLQALSSNVARYTKHLENGMTPESALKAALGTLDVTITDRLMPEYRCDCSRPRIEQALISIGEKDLTEMIQQDEGAEVRCHFCNESYRFTKEELQRLLDEARK